MCGIAGFITRITDASQNETADLRRLHSMMDRIAHRGPDGAGHWTGVNTGWRVCLGHRRLSIIDLEGGRQPLGNEDGSIQITFNGEVFNFQELRSGLEAKGHRFATRSDTESIVHHYEERGSQGLSELNGMFAFAIWDQRTGELLLARDRAGIKPLYYASTSDGGIAFASELASLLQHPGVERELDREGLACYFFSDCALHPRSLVKGVRKLEPGHFVSWKDGKLGVPKPFWTLDDVEPLFSPGKDPDEKALEEQLLAVLSDSVRRQLVSDVPLGVFLSGGIDSSLVAALASRERRDPVRTFSIAFEDPSFDESSHARLVARHIGSDHTEETLSAAALVEVCDSALSSLDEPLADPSLLPTYLLSRLTARHVKVALGGDGGDELWAGYPTYLAHRFGHLYGALPKIARQSIIPGMISALPVHDRYQSLEWKAKRFTQRWDDDPIRRHLRWMSSTDLPDLERALGPEAGASDFRPTRLLRSPLFAEDETNGFLALDFRTYLPGSVLTKVDRASMAHGLEVRPPLLDNESVAFAMGLPSSYKLRHSLASSTSKYLLKRVARRLLPASIVDRPKKGFGIPLSSWLKGPLRARVDSALERSPLWDALSRDAFRLWNREHQESRIDRSKTLWALIVLDHWMKREKIHA